MIERRNDQTLACLTADERKQLDRLLDRLVEQAAQIAACCEVADRWAGP